MTAGSADPVVVTGLGLVTPLGDAAETWDRVLAGESAARSWEDLEREGFPKTIACRVEESFADERRRGRELAIRACEEAIRHAGPGPDRVTGVFIGTTMGESAAFEAVDDLDALDLDECAGDVFAAEIAARFELGGPVRTHGTACAAGNYAIAAGAEAIRRGRVDAAIVGGVEPFSRIAMLGFARARTMTSTRCRPFDERRDGMQLGEAAAILHIESRSHARARGAETLAIVEGWGFSGDAHHAVAPRPDGSGMAAAMTACLAHARVAPEEVDWVCAHGTGTPRSDTAEARAITSCFAPSPPPVGSVKGALGHSMGASSAVEAIISVQALHHQIIPPTAGLGAPDRELGLRLPREAAPMRLERVISPAYAFGGLNSALLLRAP